MDRKRKKMIADLEGKIEEGSLQIIEGKGEDEESKEEEEYSKGKELVFFKSQGEEELEEECEEDYYPSYP